DVLVEKIRLGIAQIDLLGAERDDRADADVLTAPRKFRSRMLTSASGPSVVEKPRPTDNSPVDCSSISVLITVRSGAEPGLLLTSTFLKNPRFLTRSFERCILLVLKASPSTSRNSRRTTLSSVRTLPLMSMRST